MKLEKETEEKLKEAVLVELQKGKPEWDIPHTLCAVEWVRKLIEKEGGDERILVPALYLHDTGYPLLEKGYDYQDLMNSKLAHAERSAIFAEKILSEIGGFTPDEIREIVYLVGKHDKHANLETLSRQLVFEADGLSGIDWENVIPNFDRKNRIDFLEKYFATEKGFNRWKTETGKKYLKILLEKAEEYNKNND